jgi:hypothetical protein
MAAMRPHTAGRASVRVRAGDLRRMPAGAHTWTDGRVFLSARPLNRWRIHPVLTDNSGS